MSRHYAVFGGCLETDVEFPELRPCSAGHPRWLFAKVHRLPARATLEEIGDQHIYADVHARLFRHESGYRIMVDDTGIFDIVDNGSRIEFEEKPGAWPDFVRAHLLGRVMATALFSRGWMPLHGSAVLLDGGVVGFLAPKGFGKSTLALVLSRSGGRLVTDDTLPIEISNPVLAWPGVHSVRIANDVLSAVGIAEADLETREGKGIVTSLGEHQLAPAPAPLSAIYLLQPIDPSRRGPGDAPPNVGREKLPSVAATMSLLANFKLARMTGAASMPEVLRRAAVIADCVPVYRLFVARDLGALTAVANQIREWHAHPVGDAAGNPVR